MHLDVLAVSGFMMVIASLAPHEAEAADEDGFELTGAIHDLDPADRKFPKWTDMLRRDALQRADPTHARSLEDWRAFLATLADGDDRRRIEAVNVYVNAFRYKPDFESYEIVDVWQTPAEFFANAGGDCEDFAIAKFMSLRELGRRRIAYGSSFSLTAHVK
jgi:predicted transglutaminase-like cysteine proteinase